MKRGGIVEIMVLVLVVLVGSRVVSAIFQPDLATILVITAGTTIIAAIVLLLFFRSVRASEKTRHAEVPDPDGLHLAATTQREASTAECILLSASCTTGWVDWIHGELWLCSDGLIRRSLGLARTMAHGSARTIDPQARPKRAIHQLERGEISNAGKSNRWIAWDSIAAAETRRGPVTDSLHYRLKSGVEGKLLWLRIDDAMGPIEAAARSRLGDRFKAA